MSSEALMSEIESLQIQLNIWKKEASQLQQYKQGFQALACSLELAFYFRDAKGDVNQVSEGFRVRFCRDKRDVRDVFSILDEPTAQYLTKYERRVLDKGEIIVVDDFPMVMSDGYTERVHLRVEPVANSTGEVKSVLVSFGAHISDEDDEHLYDDLTSLMGFTGLEQAISDVIDNKRNMALFFIDVDNLIPINNSLDKDQSDRFLKDVAQAIKDTVRQGDTVARIGNDKFALMIDMPKNLMALQRIAENLSNALSEVKSFSHPEKHQLHCNIGVTRIQQDPNYDPGVYLAQAKDAMLESKKQKGQGYHWHPSVFGVVSA